MSPVCGIFFCIFVYKVVELVGGGSVINGAYPVTLLVVVMRLCVLVYIPTVLYLKLYYKSISVKLVTFRMFAQS